MHYSFYSFFRKYSGHCASLFIVICKLQTSLFLFAQLTQTYFLYSSNNSSVFIFPPSFYTTKKNRLTIILFFLSNKK
nr:MAG TPA: hypothetical protein [Caudoviricetes sp.]